MLDDEGGARHEASGDDGGRESRERIEFLDSGRGSVECAAEGKQGRDGISEHYAERWGLWKLGLHLGECCGSDREGGDALDV
jgi:hypothetical protein